MVINFGLYAPIKYVLLFLLTFHWIYFMFDNGSHLLPKRLRRHNMHLFLVHPSSASELNSIQKKIKLFFEANIREKWFRAPSRTWVKLREKPESINPVNHAWNLWVHSPILIITIHTDVTIIIIYYPKARKTKQNRYCVCFVFFLRK